MQREVTTPGRGDRRAMDKGTREGSQVLGLKKPVGSHTSTEK